MNDVLVLCYHAVSERWPASLAVRPKRLEAQLGRLVRAGYRGVTFHEAVVGRRSGKTLAVTFDDAFQSVLDIAFPIMSGLGLPGTVFVPTAFADSGEPLRWTGIEHWADGPHRDELAGLSWPDLNRLAEAGWEVGSHSHSHRRLTGLDDAALAAELGESRAACERGTGRPCRSIAYPYGDVDRRVVAAARTAGYEAGASLPARLGPADPLDWPRVGVYQVDRLWRFRLKASPRVRRLRGGG
jgi:peptidoglycan/xylan/chitin deacetylase (PgdA/CDA1 family)